MEKLSLRFFLSAEIAAAAQELGQAMCLTNNQVAI